MRWASESQIKLVPIALVLLLILAGSTKILTLQVNAQGGPTMGEWVPQGEGQSLMISSQEQVNRMMATFKNSVAGPHNRQENAKVEACRSMCPAV